MTIPYTHGPYRGSVEYLRHCHRVCVRDDILLTAAARVVTELLDCAAPIAAVGVQTKQTAPNKDTKK